MKMKVYEEAGSVIVEETNRCYNDFMTFKAMPPAKLHAMQKQYYADLHTLQAELDDLLDDLRCSLKRFKDSYLKTA